MDEIDWRSEGAQSLKRQDCFELLNRLNEKMPPMGTAADIYVVGGAAMAFEYDDARRTEDIDCVIGRHEAAVLIAAEAVAAETPGLPADWLNPSAKESGNLPEGPDPDERPSYRATRIEANSASPEWPLAMKLDANREKDVADIARLLRITGTESAREAEQLHGRAFPGKPMEEGAKDHVEALLSDPGQTARMREEHGLQQARPMAAGKTREDQSR